MNRLQLFGTILILSLLSSNDVFAQWTLIPFPTGYPANLRVHTRNRDSVVAGGSNGGAVIWSSNRGVRWFVGRPLSPEGDTISFIKHIGKDTVLVCTHNNTQTPGVISYGLDIGMFGFSSLITFANLPTTFTEYLEDAYYFPHTPVGIAVGRTGFSVYRTTNGRRFTRINAPNNRRLMRVDFADSQTGYAVGEGGVIIKSTDGGLTWTSIGNATYGFLNAVDFVTPQVGYIGGANGVYKTTNGGQSFTRVHNRRVKAVAFWTVNDGFMSDPSGTNITTDGGQSWVFSAAPNNDISCDKQGYCYAVSIAGVEFYNNPNPVTSIAEDVWTREIAFYPNPLPQGEKLFYHLPVLTSNYNVQVVNSGGQVVYKTDSPQQGKGELDLNLSPGLYHIQVMAAGRKWSQKVIVQ